MATNLDPMIRKILIFLAEQHQQGAISVSISVISDELSIQKDDITACIRRLKELRLLDELEERDQACLSATGFRLARSVKEEGADSAFSFESVLEPSGLAAPSSKDDLASTLVFLARLQEAVREEFPTVLEQAKISAEDKQKLQNVAQEFFTHPASFELLRRALARLR